MLVWSTEEPKFFVLDEEIKSKLMHRESITIIASKGL